MTGRGDSTRGWELCSIIAAGRTIAAAERTPRTSAQKHRASNPAGELAKDFMQGLFPDARAVAGTGRPPLIRVAVLERDGAPSGALTPRLRRAGQDDFPNKMWFSGNRLKVSFAQTPIAAGYPGLVA